MGFFTNYQNFKKKFFVTVMNLIIIEQFIKVFLLKFNHVISDDYFSSES